MPVAVHIGELDTDSDRIGSARTFRRMIERAREHTKRGYELLYKEYPRTGHQLPETAQQEVFRWMKQFKRESNPKRVIWEEFNPGRYPPRKNYFYWLHHEKSAPGMRIEAEIRGNTIEARAPGAGEFTIFLNDRLVDTTKPVRVIVDGTVCFEGPLAPSLTALVETYVAREDPRLVYPYRVRCGRAGE